MDESELYSVLERFNVPYLRTYQELVIKTFIENEENRIKSNFLVCLPTGSGKSLCFMLPAYLIKRPVIIVYPLLSLMNDQKKRFDQVGIGCEVVKGGMEKEERNAALGNIVSGTSRVLITNIEMLTYLISTPFKEKINKLHPTLVLDEAHTIITWGESFRECYKNTSSVIKAIKPFNILAFTATMDRKIRNGIIDEVFDGRTPYIVHSSTDRENIYYHSCRSLNKREDVKKIISNKDMRPAIIFASSRNEAEKLCMELKGDFDIRFYHAGLDKEQRLQTERWFFSSDDGLLAATNAFGMGVDKKNIRTVIHIALPRDASSYLQEAGRGGRDGSRSDSYVLYHPDEKSPLEEIFKTNICIRKNLLKLMNEESLGEERCLSCNHCIKETFISAGETEILSYIKSHPFCKKENISYYLSKSFFTKKRYKLTGWTEKEVNAAVGILINEGKIVDVYSHLLKKRKNGRRKNN